jgi:hypothetical protein
VASRTPALVTNAADPAQVKHARRKEKDRDHLFGEALRAVLLTPAGRLVMWELLSRAGIFKSVFTPSAQIYYQAGKQDFGHELMALLIACDEELYLTMEREARARARRQDLETEAVHTAATGDKEETDGSDSGNPG